MSGIYFEFPEGTLVEDVKPLVDAAEVIARNRGWAMSVSFEPPSTPSHLKYTMYDRNDLSSEFDPAVPI